jgi:hypothetical protein
VHDIPDDLAGLLVAWWRHERAESTAHLGMPRECPSTRGYVAGKNWASDHGDVDAIIMRRIIEAVDAAIDSLPPPERSAAHIAAKNIASGSQVWSSPRLPEDPAAQADVFASMVHRLSTRLHLTQIAENHIH